jgi:anti-sigma factor (TIGR02949 family)
MNQSVLHHREEHHGSHQHNDCNDILNQVQLALDGELSQEALLALEGHLHKCSECLKRHDIEKAFKTFLRSRIERKQISPLMVNRIREKLQATPH